MAARLIDLMHLDRADVLTVDADYRNLKDNDLIRAGANKSELSKIRENLSMGACFYCDPQAKQSLVGYSSLQESLYFKKITMPLVGNAVIQRLQERFPSLYDGIDPTPRGGWTSRESLSPPTPQPEYRKEPALIDETDYSLTWISVHFYRKDSNGKITPAANIPYQLSHNQAPVDEGHSPNNGLVHQDSVESGIYRLQWGIANTNEYSSEEFLFSTKKHFIKVANNWINLEYTYADGQGVQAEYVIYDLNNNELTQGQLNDQGQARVPLDNEHQQVKVRFHNDPEILKTLIKSEPNRVDKAEGLLESALNELRLTWNSATDAISEAWEETKETVSDATEWTWELLQGDFNKSPTTGQIITNTILTMIPVIDQAGDARDLAANIKTLAWDKKYNELFAWFALFFTLIGLIPTLGSVLKGVLKLVWKKAKLSEVLEVFNFFMKGNGIAWLKTLKNGKLAEYSKQAADKGYQIIAHLMTTLNRIKTYIPRKHKDLHGKLDTLYRNLQEVKTRIHKAFADIASQLSEKIGKILEEAKGNALKAQSKTTVKRQQKAKNPDDIEVDTVTNTTKNSDLNIGKNNPNYNAESQQRISNRTNTPDERQLASQRELITAHPNAHSFSRHGGGVTDQQLQQRALTGVAPDGHVKIDRRTGNPVIPPLSSAFHSNKLLVQTDQAIRSSKAFKDKLDSLPSGVNIITLTPAELGNLGKNLGSGYKRIGGSRLNPNAQGPAQRISNLNSAQGTWQRNAQTGKWETITLFPVETP